MVTFLIATMVKFFLFLLFCFFVLRFFFRLLKSAFFVVRHPNYSRSTATRSSAKQNIVEETEFEVLDSHVHNDNDNRSHVA